jgi:phosphohistidine phosphatase
MKTIVFIRHAKAAEGTTDISDKDRPLDAHGIAAIKQQKRLMRDLDCAPDVVLCSSARRASETYQTMNDAGMLSAHRVEHTDELYMAAAPKIFQLIKTQRNDFSQLMVIGHNPGLHQLVLALAGEGNEAHLSDLARTFPTFSVAVLSFDANRWDDIALSSGMVDAFFYPDMSQLNVKADGSSFIPAAYAAI